MTTQETTTGNKPKKWTYIISIIIGLLLIFLPNLSALVSFTFEVILGWLLTLGGVFQLLFLFLHKSKRDFSLWVSSIALLVVGLYFLFNPASAVMLMTWLFISIVFINGVSSLVHAFSFQGNLRIAFIINGLIGVLFAVMIWVEWPYSGLYFMGTLLGINLVMTGVIRLLYPKQNNSLTSKKIENE